MKRERLDITMVVRQLADSREKAKRLILAGAVRINGQLAGKPSDLVDETATLTVAAAEKYVSRGGYKLEAALAAFPVDCKDKTCLDLGASTGGFTDCLLQHGAACVHAVDVGKGQLAWKLRQDPRVIIHDELNARHLTGDPVDLITIDVSFISLTKVLPAAVACLKPGGHLIALIKPQFEAGRSDVGKGGVVRDPVVHERVRAEIEQFGVGLGLRLLGSVESPILGPAGNKEFLIGFAKP
ncbi:MAG: 16S/23S rRNA (cytidine-2'-O)-methyltransferase TlyA [Verrucomicrobiae bacterium]|nr:16S/23S rRNA (cytidine-2'-O)-methyltransferase TlyA [Verrucomicrobiae bacterium]